MRADTRAHLATQANTVVTPQVSSGKGGVLSRSLALSPVLSAGWVLFEGGGSAACVSVCVSTWLIMLKV